MEPDETSLPTSLVGPDGRHIRGFAPGAVVRTWTHHTHAVFCLSLLPDGLRFVSGSADKTARIVYHGCAPQAQPQ